MTTVSIHSLNATELTDETEFNLEMEKMFNRVANWQNRQPTCLEDIIADCADKAAKRILSGESTMTVCLPQKNLLKTSDENIRSSWYHHGKIFYDFYCELVKQLVVKEKPERKLAFPIW